MSQIEELESRIAQLHDDIAREEKLVSENSEILSRLDADDAACLFVVHTRHFWTYMRSYLDKHPAVRAAIAA